MNGWEAGIRTPIPWSRATCPTVGRPPSAGASADAKLLFYWKKKRRARKARPAVGQQSRVVSPSVVTPSIASRQSPVASRLRQVVGADHLLGIRRDRVLARRAGLRRRRDVATALLLLLPPMARHAAFAAG